MSRKTDGSPSTVVVAVALVTAAAIAPILVEARPANEIPVSDLAGEDASLSDPGGDAWDDTPSKTLELASAPSGAPDQNDTSIEVASVQAARTDERLYVRMSWADATNDSDAPADRPGDPPTTTATDAVAVQLPANASSNPDIAMGSSDIPVNVWYWGAQAGGEELFAGGPGTTTTFPTMTVETNATYEDGRWYVVFVRDLDVDEANRTDLARDEDVSAAFAVWNGSNDERAGRKAVSDWQYFRLGPGPQGPPYETILWTVAGLALVVVIVATVYGVRRS